MMTNEDLVRLYQELRKHYEQLTADLNNFDRILMEFEQRLPHIFHEDDDSDNDKQSQ